MTRWLMNGRRSRRRRRRDLGPKLHAERLIRDATHSSSGVALPLWRRALARHLPKHGAARRESLHRAFGRSFPPCLLPRLQFAAGVSARSILAAARQGAREAEGRRNFPSPREGGHWKKSIENQSRLKRKVSGKVSATRARGSGLIFRGARGGAIGQVGPRANPRISARA